MNLKKIFNKIFPCHFDEPLCKDNLWGCRCGKTSSKANKAEQTAAEQRQSAEQTAGLETQSAANEAERRLTEAGKTARGQMTAAGEPSAEETSRLNRYRSKALTPAETLMTESGPISQAVARRIQQNVERPVGTYEEGSLMPEARTRIKEGMARPVGTYEEGSLMPEVRARIRERVVNPGLDYERDLPAYAEGVSEPLWRSLKARGIAPPPGSEGGGLGTQQFMKGAEPALAELRARAIAEDIERGTAFGGYEEATRAENIERGAAFGGYEEAQKKEDIGAGQQYGTEARGLQDLWTRLEDVLGEAIQGRRYEAGIEGASAEQLGVREGAPYGVKGAEAKGAGFTEAARINQEEVNTRYARKREEASQLGKDIGTALMLAAAPFTGGATLAAIPAVQGMGGGGGGTASAGASLATSLLARRTPTAEVGGMGKVPVALPDYYRSKAAQIPTPIRGKSMFSDESPSSRILAKRTMGRG